MQDESQRGRCEALGESGSRGRSVGTHGYSPEQWGYGGGWSRLSHSNRKKVSEGEVEAGGRTLARGLANEAFT